MDLKNMLAIQHKNIEKLLQNLAQPQFIERPLKGSKNIYSKGLNLELQASRYYHQKEMALLVSAHLLRHLGAGQIDLATICREKITIFEVKSKPFISKNQQARLLTSASLLGEIFEKPINLTLCAKKFCQMD